MNTLKLDDMNEAVSIKRSLLRAQVDHQDEISRLIPSDIKAMIDQVNAGYSTIYATLQTELSEVEKRLKDAVIHNEQTEKVAGLTVAYRRPSVKWDDKGLTQVLVAMIALAAETKDSSDSALFPEAKSLLADLHTKASKLAFDLSACREMGEPSAAITYKLEG